MWRRVAYSLSLRTSPGEGQGQGQGRSRQTLYFLYLISSQAVDPPLHHATTFALSNHAMMFVFWETKSKKDGVARMEGSTSRLIVLDGVDLDIGVVW